MGELTVTTFLTLDGVMQAPGGPEEDPSDGFALGGWSFPYFSPAKGEVVTEVFGRAACFLLGRRTYEIFAASWPSYPDQEDPVASRLNTLPKHVASRSSVPLDWQPSSLVEGDLAAAVAGLKAQHDGEVQVHGSAGLIQSLHALGLVDEYRLIIDPVVLGRGKRLFEPGAAPTAFELVDSRPLERGSTYAVYRPSGTPTFGEFQMEEGFGLPDA